MAKVQIAQASIDEYGNTRGGQPGDQRISVGKKGETNISDRYKRSGGWDELIRCKDESIANKAAEYIIKVTNSHLVGYNQGNRNTFYKALKKYNWNIDSYIASGEKTETDCSAYVYAIYCSLIPSLRGSFEEGRVSGRNNSPACQSSWTAYNRYGNGLFERYTNSDFVNSDAYLKVGDLLSSGGVNGGHIAMIVGEDNDKYYVAESLWTPPNVSVGIYEYSKKTIFNRYYYVMLMDSYYKEDGKLTKLWY